MKTEVLVEKYPRLFHMAEPGSWELIKEYGLLSTRASLDRFNIDGELRQNLEEGHRAKKVKIYGKEGQVVILRDQKPMPHDRLEKALEDGIAPEEWYRFLNSKVFTWAQEERLNRLLNAREYRNDEHDVLVLDSAPLIKRYEESVMLCHMNSGNTFPYPHRRGWELFQSISDYKASDRTGQPIKPVAEVVFEYSIPDIKEFVLEAKRVKGDSLVKTLAL
ncbi:MAG TPA: hypothetical protein VFN01_17255 [Marinobacter sp.]|uniref:DUF7002 family protein n=1 Tax=Marinobacter sp. TaxID=50741 RepID=UPI002D8011B6|nr:hypothetical protein [Marinobacter sp.]HET8802919.1 hypothetical protein [Marinobacter sp.]